MAQKALLCLTLLSASLSAIAAPMPMPIPQDTGVDRSVLLENAQEAQALNGLFQTIKKDDPCQSELVVTYTKNVGIAWTDVNDVC